jgi:hypothetical protein
LTNFFVQIRGGAVSNTRLPHLFALILRGQATADVFNARLAPCAPKSQVQLLAAAAYERHAFADLILPGRFPDNKKPGVDRPGSGYESFAAVFKGAARAKFTLWKHGKPVSIFSCILSCTAGAQDAAN